MAKLTKDGMVTQLVLELIKGIDRAGALAKFAKKWQISDRTFDRRWSEALIRYQGQQERVQKKVEEAIVSQTVSAFTEASITRERVLQEYARIAFSDITSFFDDKGVFIGFDKLTADQRAVLSAIETEEQKSSRNTSVAVRKFKVWDKRGALDAIVKIMGWNAPIKEEITGKDGSPLFSGFDTFMAECRKIKLDDDEEPAE